MSRRTILRAKRAGWQLMLTLLALVQIAGTFTKIAEPLYAPKQLAALGIGFCLFLLGRCRLSRQLSREFVMMVVTITIGLLTQIEDTIDFRAMALAASYATTITVAFLVAPSALRRRSVHRIVWPALLLGVTIGTVVGIVLGLQDFFASFSFATGRLRFAGGFYSANAAGVAGLIGVTLAVAAFEARRRWFYLLPIPMFAVVMVLADSRGAILAAIVIVAAYPLLQVARWPPRRLAITLTLTGAGMVLAGSMLAARIDWPTSGQWGPELNRISSGRVTNWREALSYIDSPLRWTFGLGMSRNLSFAYEETDFPVPIRGSNADNFFVDMVGRTGLVGLSLILAMLGSLTLRMWRGLIRGSRRSTSRYALGLAVLASTIMLGGTNSIIFTWAWLQAIVAWPLVAGAATHTVDAASRIQRA